jgi:hypothetical protein
MEIPEGYTAEEWEGLSDAEREGIIDSLKNPEGGETEGEYSEEDLKSIAGEEPKEEPPKEEPPKEEPPKEEPPKEEPKEDKISDEALAAYRPVVTSAELNLEEVIPPELKTQLDELKVDLDEGTINIHDYSEARDKINRQIFKHNQKIEDEAKSEAAWKKEQLFFLQARPEYLPGTYEDAAGKIKANALFGALNEMVKSVAVDPANAHLSGMQILIKADAEVKKTFGLAKKEEPKKEEPKKEEPKKPPAVLPDHKTLSDVPPAAQHEDDPYAQLDKLTGESYEAALERLTPDQREAYLNKV